MGSDLFVTYAPGGNYADGMVGEYTTSGATVNASLIAGLYDPLGIASLDGDLLVGYGEGAGVVGEFTTSGATVNSALISGLEFPTGIVVVATPEPGSLAFAGLAFASLLGYAWRRRGRGQRPASLCLATSRQPAL